MTTRLFERVSLGIEGFDWQQATVGWVICRRCGWWSALVAPYPDADQRAKAHRAECTGLKP